MLIANDELDRRRFVRLLYYLNDEYRSDFWEEDVRLMQAFERPAHWPKRDPLVSVVAWTLMPNHFHLVLEEIQEGGVSRFMQSLCGSMTRHFNEKYDEQGSIFQGAYQSRTIEGEAYSRWIIPYVLAKNVFEMYPGGYQKAIAEFDRAWRWATEEYEFSSLMDHSSNRDLPIVSKQSVNNLLGSHSLKNLSRDMVLGRKGTFEMRFE